MLNSALVHSNVKQTVWKSYAASVFVIQSAAVWPKISMPKHKFFALVLTSFYFSCSYKCWETLFKAHAAYWTSVTLVKSLECHKFSSQLNSKLNSQAWSSICSSIGSVIQDSICNSIRWSLICSQFHIQFTCWSTWCGDNMIVDVCVN